MKKNNFSPNRWPDEYIPPPWLPSWKEKEHYDALTNKIEHQLVRSAVDKKSRSTNTVTQTIPTEKVGFAWEFLRRNPYYQADYSRLNQMAQEENVSSHYYTYSFGLNINLRDEPLSPSVAAYHAELYHALVKWGLTSHLPDPAFDIFCVGDLRAFSRNGNNCYISINCFDFNGENIPQDGGIILSENEALWVFDVSLPLGPQLNQAKNFLIEYQEVKYEKKLSASKTSQKDFPMYLRILDADACGVKDDDIAWELFPNQHDSAPKNRTPHKDALNKSRIPAYDLRDRFYRLS